MANKVDQLHNATTKNAITFLYLAAFSPAITTLTTAIQKGFFKSWPGFTVEATQKYVSNMPNQFRVYEVPYPKWNHLDYMWGIDADKYVYTEIIKDIADFQHKFLK